MSEIRERTEALEIKMSRTLVLTKTQMNARYFHITHAVEKADGKHVITKYAAMWLVNYGTSGSMLCFNETHPFCHGFCK